MRRLKLLPLAFIVITLFLEYGCTSYKKIVYMQDRFGMADSVSNTISVTQNGAVSLLPGDNLYINVYGADLGLLDIFNKQSNTYANFNEYSLYMQGYVIDDLGDVELPIVGKIKVEGLSLTQAQRAIQDSLNLYIVGAVVDVRLLSFEISVLGEVQRPGTYTFLRREISIFDALGRAGDARDFGDKRSILIIRKEDGVSKTIEVDMTSSEFISDSLYWLKPNDIIYVKPLRSKMVNVNSTTISIILSSITVALASVTSFVLVLNYMNN